CELVIELARVPPRPAFVGTAEPPRRRRWNVSLFSVSSPSTHAQLGIAAETPPLAEPRRQQLIRHRHRLRLYTWTVLFIAALVVLAVLIAANARSVKLDWVFGSTH